MAEIRSEFPQVYFVRIPDPDCKSILPQVDPFCRDVVIPVGESKVQSGLWKFDTDHNHVLDANDIIGDAATFVPGGTATRLAQILVGTQYIDGGKLKFASAEAVVSYARAHIAINRAYDTVQFLQGLKSHHVNDGQVSTEHEFSAADWEKIVSQLGVGGNGYVDQVHTAYAGLEAFMESAKMVNLTLSHEECDNGGCSTYIDGWVIDPTSLPDSMRSEFFEITRKMAVIETFALKDEIECEGSDCPVLSESGHPIGKEHNHGGRIAIRENDTPKGERVFLQFSSPNAWAKKSGYASYLPDALAYMSFIPTSASK